MAHLRRLDVDARKLAISFQAHGNDLHIIRNLEEIPLERLGGIDGWILGDAHGVTLGIFCADCLPVFLISGRRPLAALLHAGWKGLDRGILEKAFSVLESRFGAASGEFTAAIGPHIRSCCYEVGPEVASRFDPACVATGDEKPRLDLELSVVMRLKRWGIGDIQVSADCTRCSQNPLFFSRRRGVLGTQLALLSFV